MDVKSPKKNKLTLNNYMVQNRPLARQGKDHVIKRLIRVSKKMREKKTDDDKQKKRFQLKADRLLQEVKFLKQLHPDDVLKFALLNKKSFAAVGNNPKAKIEERALCRVAEHKGINTSISKFRDQCTDWSEDIPVFIKGLGVRHRDKKLKKLKRLGKLESFLKKERQYLSLLQEFTDIDIDPNILRDSTSATKEIEEKQTSSINGKRKKKMNSKSLKVVKRRKAEKNVDQVGKENDSGVGESGKGEDNDKVNVAMESKGNEKEVEKMTEEEIKESTMSYHGSHEIENIDSENDICADDSESEHRDNEASTINGENDSDNEDSNESDTEDQSDCSDDGSKRIPVRKSNVSSKCHIVSKIDKTSGTAEVKQLDLKNINGSIQGNEDHKIMDSDDEDFFFGKTEPGKTKTTRKSSFFLRSGKDEESEDDEGTDDYESDNRESARRSFNNDAVDSDDNLAVDSSKFFKRNLYRNFDGQGQGENRGRGGNRGRIGNRGRGDRGQGRNRGQQWDRGHRGPRGDRSYRGHRERGGGKRNYGKGEGEDNGEKRLKSENVNKDMGYMKDNIEYGGGGRRGESQRPGTERGRSQVDRVHSRGYPRGKQFSRGSNRGRQGQRSGTKSRSGMRSQFSKQLRWQRDGSNPNLIPLQVKGETAPAPSGHQSSLHPSWQAKLREKQQSASIHQFYGKHMVFDNS